MKPKRFFYFAYFTRKLTDFTHVCFAGSSGGRRSGALQLHAPQLGKPEHVTDAAVVKRALGVAAGLCGGKNGALLVQQHQLSAAEYQDPVRAEIKGENRIGKFCDGVHGTVGSDEYLRTSYTERAYRSGLCSIRKSHAFVRRRTPVVRQPVCLASRNTKRSSVRNFSHKWHNREFQMRDGFTAFIVANAYTPYIV